MHASDSTSRRSSRRRRMVPRFAVGSSPRTALGIAISAVLGLFAGSGGKAFGRDILRPGTAGSASAQTGHAANVAAATGTTPAAANARDILVRTASAVKSVQAMQAAARQAALKSAAGATKNLPPVPNGLAPGGLQLAASGASGAAPVQGALSPVQSVSNGRTTVNIKQTQQEAVLNWQTFNVGKQTTVNFDQSQGGADASKWIAFNVIHDPSGVPSQILGSINAIGQVYLINQNGIIFGGSSQINVHTLAASALPINTNLIANGLLNSTDGEFLFSALPSGTFTPTLAGTAVADPVFTPTTAPITLAKPTLAGTTPTVTAQSATNGTQVLVAGTDYTFTRGAAGKTVVTLTLAGLAKASGAAVSVSYVQAKQATAKLTEPTYQLAQTLAAKASPTVTFTAGGETETLKAGTDFKVKTANGKSVITFTEAGLIKLNGASFAVSYEDAAHQQVTDPAATAGGATYQFSTPLATGTDPVLTVGGKTLVAGTDYTLNSGTGSVIFSVAGLEKIDGRAVKVSYDAQIADPSFNLTVIHALGGLLATSATPTVTGGSGADAITLTATTDYTVATQTDGRSILTLTSSGLQKLAAAGVEENVSISYDQAKIGDVVVEPGARLTSPASSAHVGGRITLVGQNVINEGTISAPDGQTILAAGYQAGFIAHTESDASLRGVDTYIGQVPFGGTATNTGLIEAVEADVTMAGKNVKQLGVIDSSTSVTLNGRVDLLASYGAIFNPNFSATKPGSQQFLETSTGNVTLGPGSVTQILPETDSDATIIGTQLALPSVVNVQGLTIHLQNNAIIEAPNAQAVSSAGTSSGNTAVDAEGINLSAGVSLAAGKWDHSASQLGSQLYSVGGQVYLDAGAAIDVSGSTNVPVPVAENIVSVQLLGSQLANSPLQRAGILHGETINIDLRVTGVSDGIPWVGTPLADASGFVNLIQRGVGELTVAGGTVNLSAGGSVVLQPGSSVNVAGGSIAYQGGVVATSRLLTGGQLIDISQASPGLVYEGIYTGQSTSIFPKFGLSMTQTNPLLLNGTHYENGYVQGADGGSLTISAPAVALAGNLYGNTTAGPRQRSLDSASTTSNLPAPSTFALNIQAQQLIPGDSTYTAYSPYAPTITFDAGIQTAANSFGLDRNGNPLPLAKEHENNITLSPDLLTLSGFGNIEVNNSDGRIVVPAGVSLNTAAGGSISLQAANMEIDGQIIAPGGSISLEVTALSPYDPFFTLNTQNSQAYLAAHPLGPSASAFVGRGNFKLGATALLSTAGLIVDDRPSASAPNTLPLVTNGGSITIKAYNATLAEGSTLDVSGGVAVSPTSRQTYGAGGTIDIEAGLDPAGDNFTAKGTLGLQSTLLGFAGQGSAGGSLTVHAPSIQIGGTAANSKTLLLDPTFFSQGGFTSFTLVGIGGPSTPAILIAPDTVLEPIAENRMVTQSPTDPNDITLTPTLLPQAQRTAVSLSFGTQPAVTSAFVTAQPFAGNLVLGAGALIRTDPLGSVAFNGDTVAILGSIVAPAGSITITGKPGQNLAFAGPAQGTEPVATVELGAGSLLSTAGAALLTPGVHGYLSGSVLPGGTITISGNIVAQAGSVLDVSGTSSTLDLSPALSDVSLQGSQVSSVLGSLLGATVIPTRVDSAGGAIVLNGNQELFSNATLLGAAGGPTAQGGSLTVSTGTFVKSGDPQPSPVTPELVVTQNGTALPANYASSQSFLGIVPLDAKGKPITHFNATDASFVGDGFIGVNSFASGGFDNISLVGTVKFSGPVSLSSNATLSVGASTNPNAPRDGGAIIANSTVSLSAPYVQLGLAFLSPGDSITLAQKYAPSFGPGQLTVSAGLIDIGDLSLQNIGNASFVAANGDIRGDGTLDVQGHVSLTAGQIYPPTELTFNVFAYDYQTGAAGHQVTHPGSITIIGSGTRALPLSGGGTLGLYASDINQGGVLRAPIGTINLGWDGSGTAPADDVVGTLLTAPTTSNLRLLSGSVTSVSAVDPTTGVGLLIPYGVNFNGVSWIDPSGQDITTSGVPAKSVNLSAKNVSDQAGSTIDLTGGGDLFAYRFISGTGGVTDVTGSGAAWIQQPASTPYLAGQVVSYQGSYWSALQSTTTAPSATNPAWAKLATAFAVIPGYQANYSPYAPYNSSAISNVAPNANSLGTDAGYTSSSLSVGEQVYLGASSGLPAGVYTLLPARYALMPGAYLVTPLSTLPTGTHAFPLGSSIVSGYEFNGLSKSQTASPLTVRFEVDPGSVVTQRETVDTFTANSFLAQAAVANGVAVPRLPMDGGQLVLQIANSLSVHGTVAAPAAMGGQGGLVDISSPGTIVIGSSETGSGAGKVTLDAAELSSFGADSLLIGGIRTFSSAGTTVTVQTDNIDVANAGSPLTGPDVILAANDKITLEKGASIRSSGTLSGGAEHLSLIDSTEIQSGAPLTFSQGGRPISFPQGTPGSTTLTSTVAGSFTQPGGLVTSFAAGTPFKLPAGSTVTLNGSGSLSYQTMTGAPASVPVTLGDGVVVRVSSDPGAAIARSGFTGSQMPSLVVNAGATISGTSVILDSTYATSLSPAASVAGKYLTLDSGQISLVLNGAGTLPASNVGLVLSGGTLGQLAAGANSLSLLSYSSIDVYGGGTVGSGALGQLAFHAAAIRGFDETADAVTVAAQTIALDDSVNGLAPGVSGSANQTIEFQAETIQLGNHSLAIDQFADVRLTATSRLTFRGTGQLAVAGDLDISTPLISGANSGVQTITAGGDVVLSSLKGTGLQSIGGLGATLSIVAGSSLTEDTHIFLPSGTISLEAKGANPDASTAALTIGGTIDVSGTSETVVDLIEFTPGGSVSLQADTGSVDIADKGKIDVSAPAAGGNAGSLAISALAGGFTSEGDFQGRAGTGGKAGTFSLATGSLLASGTPAGTAASVGTLTDTLAADGFKESITIRDAHDQLVQVDGMVKVNHFSLSADGGSIDVTGTLDASGAHQSANSAGTAGGSIFLSANGNVTIEQGALLDVSGGIDNAAGKGGAVTLQAGSEINGTVGNGAVTVLGKIDLSVDSITSANAALMAQYGLFTGTLHLRSPQATIGNTVLSDGSVVNASNILIEGYQLFDLTSSGGAITTAVETSVSTFGTAFVQNNAGLATALASGSTTANVIVVAPGAEIIDTTGDLTLSSDWNLATFRFGANKVPGVLTLRAKGNLIFNGALSDGFDTTKATDTTHGTSNILRTAPLLAQNKALPENLQSWSYNLTAGADLSAAAFSQVLPTFNSTGAVNGSLELGKFDSTPFGTQGNKTTTITSTLVNGFYQVIRTGTGDINIAAAGDVQFLNPFATIYTAGAQVAYATSGGTITLPNGTLFDLPVRSTTDYGFSSTVFGTLPTFWSPQFSLAGGDVSIQAGRDIIRITNGQQLQSELQMPTDWLYHRGSVGTNGVFTNTDDNGKVASTGWWVDFSNFFEGVGALGGGNVSMIAGRNVENVDAVVPTNALMGYYSSTAALPSGVTNAHQAVGGNLVELGGGNLLVNAGGNLNAGVYYVERGDGVLNAGGQILTNSTRAIVSGTAAASNSLDWLPTTLFLGQGSFDVTARGNLELGPIANAFLLPVGYGNFSVIDSQGVFSTYASSDEVNVTSIGGTVTLKQSSSDENSLLYDWYFNNLLYLANSNIQIANQQPWLRVDTTQVGFTSNVPAHVAPRITDYATNAALLPATLRVNAPSGDINVVGNVLLSPSPTGTVELAARGSINALQPAPINSPTSSGTQWIAGAIDLSDSDPAAFAGITTPVEIFTVSSFFDVTAGASGGNNPNAGSSQGILGFLQVKEALHDSNLLHADDPDPVRLYAADGSISGLSFFSGKAARIVAGEDISDVGFFVQNVRDSDISIVTAGRDILPFDPNSPLRHAATTAGNTVNGPSALTGDLQISGPGTLEVLAGRDLNLGAGTITNLDSDLGLGITSIGNTRDPFLPFGGASLVTAAGLGPNAGLAQSQLDFGAFIAQDVKSSAGQTYLSELVAQLGGSVPGASGSLTAADLEQMPVEKRDLLALDLFFIVLRDAGRDQSASTAQVTGTAGFQPAFDAISALIPNPGQGDITLAGKSIATQSGGDINVLAPGGGLSLGNVVLSPPPGIVTQDGGNISIMVKADVDIGVERIFTLRGGNEIIWSSNGNIAAGSSSKTVVTAPPTRVLVDPISGDVETDLAGLATGGGIGVLASVQGVAAGNVDLIAPNGVVDAGDAGIRATGNLSIAAVAVLNASNIQAGGSTAGVPVVAAPPVSLAAVSAGNAAAGASTQASTELTKQNQAPPPAEEPASNIIVEVTGYGGGDSDSPDSGL